VSYLFAIALQALALQHVDSILRNCCEHVMPYFKFLRFEDKFDRRDPDLKIEFYRRDPDLKIKLIGATHIAQLALNLQSHRKSNIFMDCTVGTR
jgi:hypothetical protein